MEQTINLIEMKKTENVLNPIRHSLPSYLNEIQERMIRRFQMEFPADKWDMIQEVIENHFENIANAIKGNNH